MNWEFFNKITPTRGKLESRPILRTLLPQRSRSYEICFLLGNYLVDEFRFGRWYRGAMKENLDEAFAWAERKSRR